MAIHYSLLPRREDPRAERPTWRVYAAAQSTETVTLEKIAHHLASHNSVFSEGTIIGLLTDFDRCIIEHLKNGARVNLGDLGTFYTTLQGRGAKCAEEFSPSFVDHIHVRWRISKKMDAAMQHARLVKVSNRAYQRMAKKKDMELVNEEIAASRHREGTPTGEGEE